MSTPLRMVLDTNVFVAAAISGTGAPAQLLRHAESGTFGLVASPLLLAELAEVLERPKFRKYLTLDEARAIVAEVRVLADALDDPAPSEDAITTDPDDEYLVVLAEPPRRLARGVDPGTAQQWMATSRSRRRTSTFTTSG